MDRFLLIGATLCFLASFGYTLFALGAGRFKPGRVNFAAVAAGFLLLSGFLYLRGSVEGSCPVNSLFDVLIFQSWSLVLIYLIVGPTYRLSLLGAFTAPFAFFLVLAALIAPLDQSPVRRATAPYIEFHVTFSLIAYGAFGLACVAGIMYLVQERQLKAHKASQLLYHLPPISHLAAAIGRLLWVGFGLLTLGFAAGILSQLSVNNVKFATSAFIWVFYGVILTLHSFHTLAPRRMAELAIAVFALAMVTLPGIQYLSSRP